jgi:hypothetical protein
MNNYSNTHDVTDSGINSFRNSTLNSVNHNNTQHAKHYTNMDLCSQAQMSESADNILSRMEKLRAFAREQQTKRMKSQRQQTSFCF